MAEIPNFKINKRSNVELTRITTIGNENCEDKTSKFIYIKEWTTNFNNFLIFGILIFFEIEIFFENLLIF